jgi:hypothetical protein
MINADNNFPENHRYYSKKGVSKSLPLNFFMERYTQSYANEMIAFCNMLTNKVGPLEQVTMV